MLYNRGHDPEYKLFEFFLDTFAYAGEFFEWNRKGRGVADDSSANYDFYVEISEETEPEDFCAFLGKLDNVTAKIISGRDVCVSVGIYIQYLQNKFASFVVFV